MAYDYSTPVTAGSETTEKFKIGIVGLGMGTSHINSFREHPAADIVAIADLNDDLLQERGKEYAIKGLYTSLTAMLDKEQLDIVCIAVPNKFHKELTIEALRAGIHVICEKPMAINATEAAEMLAVAEETGKRLMVNFSFRFNEQSYAMKKLVDSGELGDIYFARSVWHRRRGMPKFGGWFGQKALSGGGPLIDLGVHRLDLALWLMGYPEPEWVMASAYDHIASKIAEREQKTYDVEDLAVALIKFKNGATLELEASWAANIKEQEHMATRLLGKKGGLLQHNIGEGYQFEAEFYLEKEGCQFDMKLHPPVSGVTNSLCSFIDSIINDEPHIATAEQGLTVMRLLDAIYESAATGQPVKVG
ncbi:MAG: Gfo/Idh/MocA family oxidoreductase [Victivallaceae bacterium]|nr:Gfo/Idh/MocA family oxidoreductase [Victivallaceae bacterium]